MLTRWRWSPYTGTDPLSYGISLNLEAKASGRVTVRDGRRQGSLTLRTEFVVIEWQICRS
jgi:hypothetical protein